MVLVHVREDHRKERKPFDFLLMPIPLPLLLPHLRRCPETGSLQPGCGFLQPWLVALLGPKAGCGVVSLGDAGWELGQFFWILPLCWVDNELSGGSTGHSVSCTRAALRGGGRCMT